MSLISRNFELSDLILTLFLILKLSFIFQFSHFLVSCSDIGFSRFFRSPLGHFAAGMEDTAMLEDIPGGIDINVDSIDVAQILGLNEAQWASEQQQQQPQNPF